MGAHDVRSPSKVSFMTSFITNNFYKIKMAEKMLVGSKVCIKKEQLTPLYLLRVISNEKNCDIFSLVLRAFTLTTSF